MKIQPLYPTARACLLGTMLLLNVTVGTLQAASPAVANKIVFTESYADKLYCSPGLDNGWICEADDTTAFTVSATVSGVFTGLTVNTPFIIDFDLLSISLTLSNDAKYTAGKSTSATLVNGERFETGGKLYIYNTTQLKWTAKQVKITITCGKIGGSIAAPDYDLAPSGKISSTDPGRGALTATITFGNTHITFTNVAFNGTVKTKPMRGRDGETHPLSTISLKGSGAVP